MRDTEYATELTAPADIGGARIERLFVKDEGQEEIRFSWWQEGRLIIRPLDLPEDALLALMRQAILERDIFTAEFLNGLQAILAERQHNA